MHVTGADAATAAFFLDAAGGDVEVRAHPTPPPPPLGCRGRLAAGYCWAGAEERAQAAGRDGGWDAVPGAGRSVQPGSTAVLARPRTAASRPAAGRDAPGW